MKSNLHIISMALAFSFAGFFSSCQKNPDNYISQPALSVNDLNIPPSFDWKLTNTIQLTFESSTPTLIEVHDQNRQAFYFKGMHNGHDPLTTTISIPTYQNSLFVNGKSYNVNATSQTINLDLHNKTALEGSLISLGPENLMISNNYIENNINGLTSSCVISPSEVLISYLKQGPEIGTFVGLLHIDGLIITLVGEAKITSEIALFQSLTKTESGRVLFTYTSNSQSGSAKITPISINGLQLSIGIENAFTGPDAQGPRIFELDNDIFIMHYISPPWFGRIKLMHFDGTSFTNVSDSLEYASKVHEKIPDLFRLPNNNILLVNRQQHPEYGMSFLWNIYNVTGNTIQEVNSFQFPNPDNSLTGIFQLGEKFITNGYMDEGLMHLFHASGNNVNYLSTTQIILPNGGYQSAAAIDDNSFLTTYFTFENNGDQHISLCDVTGNSITKVEELQFNYHKYLGLNLIHKLQENKFIVLANNRELLSTESNFGNIYGYIVTLNNTPTADTDADGVPDDADDYPNDPNRAFDNYFPANGFGSLGFEDLWPGKGDYDFNDMVIDYRFKTVTNAQNEIVEITATFPVKAAGAAYVNGFGFSLRNTPATITDNMTIAGNELSESLVSLSDKGWEANQSIPTTIVFDNIFSLLPHPGMGIGVNTELNAPFVNYDTIRLSFTPSVAISYTQFSIASWNPFVLVNKDRSHEVHLPYYEPTGLFDFSLFGQWEDNSDPAQDRYFLTANNLPWGIDIPSSFIWPTEKTEITEAYSKFAAWAESGGALYNDWFLNQNGNINESKVYIRND